MPPFAAPNVPVIVMTPDVVIGELPNVRPVVPPETPTLVTVPSGLTAQETSEPSVVRKRPLLPPCGGRIAFAAPAWVVAPVPPDAKASVPASVNVPEVVIGFDVSDVTERPVDPVEKPTLVTVPDGFVSQETFAPFDIRNLPF